MPGDNSAVLSKKCLLQSRVRFINKARRHGDEDNEATEGKQVCGKAALATARRKFERVPRPSLIRGTR